MKSPKVFWSFSINVNVLWGPSAVISKDKGKQVRVFKEEDTQAIIIFRKPR